MALLSLKNLIFPQPKSQILPSFTQQQQQQTQHKYGTCETSSLRSTSSTSSTSSSPSTSSTSTQKPGTTSTSVSSSSSSASSRIDPRIISDATIGLSDGLTVPFALTAGLSALGNTKLVIYGGLAELIAGAISMGLGGYLGGVGEAQSHAATLSTLRKQISTDPDSVSQMIASTLQPYNLTPCLISSFTSQISSCPETLESYLLQHHHHLPSSSFSSSRAYISAITIATGYLVGGLIPLTPYFFTADLEVALGWSVGVMVLALFGFGYGKGVLVGEEGRRECVRGGVQMVVLGGLAAGAAMGCVVLLGR